ncbi:DUF3817 domain-containing protein [Frankia sp. Cppng1_Ct_nod]|uniref:DUF3817 domain-containing protein n=1 Tax=Frankia sp. Cppng1_Ct_nod TaxID=2897162 RepID=UPI002023FCBD|nr:DUF3817 domain-containing protein [Frankia sp. Cppng1_Ct_nod]
MPDDSERRSRAGTRTLPAARAVSVAEATSFLLLLVATAVKYGADRPGGVRVLGPIHGVLFLAYCAIMIAVAVDQRWPVSKTLLALGASVLPVAPYFVERRWLRGSGAGTPTADVAVRAGGESQLPT